MANLRRLLRVTDWAWGRGAHARCISWGLGALYGLLAHTGDASNRTLICVTMTISIMHFWYDGFIWSVRKRQV